jgi:SAM-dependent methyltransferase
MDREAWNGRYAAAADLVWTAEPNRFVVQELAELPPGRALDLAAGEGRNAVWLAAQGWRVVAVDFSSVAIARGRRLAEQHGVQVDWIVADVLRHPLPKAAFDLVVIAYLQLTAADLARVLHRAVGALAPGGTILVVGHDRANLDGGVGGPQDPAVLQTPAEVLASLDGLTVQRAETVRRPVSIDGETVDALDTLVVAAKPRLVL